MVHLRLWARVNRYLALYPISDMGVWTMMKQFTSLDQLKEHLLQEHDLDFGDTWIGYDPDEQKVHTTFVPLDGLPIENEYTLDEFVDWLGDDWEYCTYYE